MKLSTGQFCDGYLEEDDIIPGTNQNGEKLMEWVAIEEMIRVFSQKMRLEMFKHFIKGKKGWDSPETHPNSYIIKVMRKAMNKGDYVSLANYAMMLWNRVTQD